MTLRERRRMLGYLHGGALMTDFHLGRRALALAMFHFGDIFPIRHCR
jgi:hypothetical protein